jgi:hypothetical protein
LKNKFPKAIISLSLALMVVAPSVYAEKSSVEPNNIEQTQALKDSEQLINSDSVSIDVQNKTYNFSVSKDVKGKIKKKALMEVALQADSNGKTIHIDKIADNNTYSILRSENNNFALTPFSYAVNWYTVKTTTSTDNAAPRVFITSVAKGQTKKLTSTFTAKTTRSITFNTTAGIPNEVSASIEGQVTTEVSSTYSTEITWAGPPETSTAVSRNYYWTGFRNYGNWRSDGYEQVTNKYVNSYLGSFIEPKYYVEWSQDIN